MVQSWFNTDGLYLKFGTDKTTATVAGDYKTYGNLRIAEVTIDLTTLTSTAAILADTTYIGKYRIEEVELEVQTAATSGGSPTLDVGTMTTSDRTTVISNTSFVAAEVLSGKLDTVGTKVVYTAGVSKAGAAIGTTLPNPAYICARANTATYTAGSVIVRIKYRA